MKTLLFTGASGFLGSNVLPLLKENYEVDTLALDENATYNTVDDIISRIKRTEYKRKGLPVVITREKYASKFI